MDRIILLLLPIYIILICKPLDIVSKSRWIILFILFITFTPQIILNVNYVKVKTIFKKEPAREYAKFIAENIKQNDTIFVNASSKPEFYYYRYIYKIPNKVIYELPENNVNPDRVNLILNQLNQLDGNTWLYLPGDIPSRKVLPAIINWITSTNKNYIEYSNLNSSSYLLYIMQ